MAADKLPDNCQCTESYNPEARGVWGWRFLKQRKVGSGHRSAEFSLCRKSEAASPGEAAPMARGSTSKKWPPQDWDMKNYIQNEEGTDLERIRRRFTLQADIADWTDQQARLLRMSPSTFVGTLLEWARDEDFANDEMLFQPASLNHVRNHSRQEDSVPNRSRLPRNSSDGCSLRAV